MELRLELIKILCYIGYTTKIEEEGNGIVELQSKLLNAIAIASFKQNIVVFGLIRRQRWFQWNNN